MKTLISNKMEVMLEFFFQNPTRMLHLRELSRELGVSFPWTRKLVSVLEKEGLLTKKREHALVLVRANRDSGYFQQLKRSYNLVSIFKSGLHDRLVDAYNRPEAVILFGSYSRGEDTEGSDIDIGIISKRTAALSLDSYEKKLKRRISVHELDREKIQKEFWNTLANGIVLSGYLELP